MIRWLVRWLLRAVLVLVVLVLILLSPILWIEAACRGGPVVAGPLPILTEPEWQRAETRTLLTYPEWHIVHAYDDYAAVISYGDPHEFGFVNSVLGFWQALCPLTREAGRMGEITTDTKLTIYTIGVSFSLEMALKAAYEETVGRIVAGLRGPERAPLDDLSARQADDYARFLQQVPWYQWDFRADRAALQAAATDVLRDRERAFALGVESSAKAAYAGVIAQAVAGMEPDALRMRSVVAGMSVQALADVEGVTVIGEVPEGVMIETPRYRAFTDLFRRLASQGLDAVEIAGNDEILFTAVSEAAVEDGALYSFARQGHGDWRHLFLLPVSELAGRIRAMEGSGLRLEHIHDY